MGLKNNKRGLSLEGNIGALILFVAVILVIFYILLRLTGSLSSVKCALKSIFGQGC